MNLFEIADPKKRAEAQRCERIQQITKDPALWPVCVICKTKISPLAVSDETADGPVCLTCYMKRRNKNV